MSTKPQPDPANLGEPCWEMPAIDRAITSTAQVLEQRAHYFLASHAPIKHIRPEKGAGDKELDEETLFQALLNQDREEILAVVSGEPGTGKSHLIHWLKLRCQHALDTG